MAKVYALLLLVFFACTATAQVSLLNDNEFVINQYAVSPSFTGFNGGHEIFAGYINHFTGVKGAPNSAWVDYNGTIKRNMGLGAALRYEKFGAFRNIRIYLSYAYHLNIGSDHKVSIGIGVPFTQTTLDLSNSNSDPVNDPSLNSGNTKSGIGFNVAAGIGYAFKKFSLGIAAPSIIPLKKSAAFIHSQPLHIRAYAAYDIVIGRTWSVKPQVLFDYILNAPINYNGIVTVKYNNQIWLNAGYGAGNIVNAGLGGLIAGRFAMQYTFKYGLQGVAGSAYGSHEICLGVLVGKFSKNYINNSVFRKNSKSPYHEWE